MFASLLRLAREGTLVVALAVPVVSVPAIAHAGWFQDIKDLSVALPQVFNPSHDLGKLGLGGLLFGGAPILALIPVVGVPLAIGSAVIGLGLLAWGAYNINHWESDEGSQPNVPGTTGGGVPGNIPGGTNPNPPGGTSGGGGPRISIPTD